MEFRRFCGDIHALGTRDRERAFSRGNQPTPKRRKTSGTAQKNPNTPKEATRNSSTMPPSAIAVARMSPLAVAEKVAQFLPRRPRSAFARDSVGETIRRHDLSAAR